MTLAHAPPDLTCIKRALAPRSRIASGTRGPGQAHSDEPKR
jgi:hypothetical protein